MKTENVNHSEVREGDLILPPERELSLWMRRNAKEKGLPEDSLLLTVEKIVLNYKQDKRGSWTLIKAKYSKTFANENEISFQLLPSTSIRRLSKQIEQIA